MGNQQSPVLGQPVTWSEWGGSTRNSVMIMRAVERPGGVLGKISGTGRYRDSERGSRQACFHRNFLIPCSAKQRRALPGRGQGYPDAV